MFGPIKLRVGLFQSLVGFKINWNFRMIWLKLLFIKFQSLVGFKINWNMER